jgi:flagellar hook-associated protein 1 FlgK
MGTINSTLSLISEGLNADQSALNIVANNVANANTTGYTKETANFSEAQSLYINGV